MIKLLTNRLILGTFVFITSFSNLFSGEGMWLPHLLKQLNEAEMQSMGMKMTAEDIYSINKGSLKDAVVHFNGGCTSEIISSKGLLLTNHHCGYSQIQQHSTVENNLLKNGFWSQSYSEELPNKGLSATFIDRIYDVTDKILVNLTVEMSDSERRVQIAKNQKKLEKETSLESYQKLVIRAFYNGNQYIAFVTVTYLDVRLVAAPPESIGKFGSDTDNWIWPRHTGDFSVFRIYADTNNLPAAYSEENIPYTPKHFLPVSIDGIEKNDFTMIFGFPGRTDEYLPAIAVDQRVNILNPAKIEVREKALSVMHGYMIQSEEQRLKYAPGYARIANYWKKWIGESTGVLKTNGIQRKKDIEKEFSTIISNDETLNSQYAGLLTAFDTAYRAIIDPALARDLYYEVFGRNVRLMRFMHTMHRLMDQSSNPKAFQSYKEKLTPKVIEFYNSLDSKMDKEIFAEVMEVYFKRMPENMVSPTLLEVYNSNNGSTKALAIQLYNQSIFGNKQHFMEVWNSPDSILIAKFSSDLTFKVTKANAAYFYNDIQKHYKKLKYEIDDLQSQYMTALMKAFPDRKFYPDANSTMRITYGKVEGYQPEDSISYEPFTYLSGVIKKYKPDDYEFDVSPKLIDLYNKKDFGPYADDQGRMPVCFIGSNHTTGGNSGSPVIDAYGNLIGLNFDRVWEGTMSDINYDPKICRNIMVDVRYILFLIDKYGECPRLIDEMKLVHPKS